MDKSKRPHVFVHKYNDNIYTHYTRLMKEGLKTWKGWQETHDLQFDSIFNLCICRQTICLSRSVYCVGDWTCIPLSN